MIHLWTTRVGRFWAVLILLLFTVLVTVMPTRAQTTSPTLSVGPTSSIAGQSVTLFGNDYPPGPGKILWDGSDVMDVIIPSTATSFSLPFTIPISASVGLHKITLCSGTPCLNQSAGTTIRIDMHLSDISVELRRRALQFLEEMRSGPMAPGWYQAVLSQAVRPLYRPDLPAPAYYEFIIQSQPVHQATPAAAITPQYGFMILASGVHDSPIAHWNYIGNSPTQELDIQAARNQQPLIAKFYKLDTLVYAGEDAGGNRVAYLGSELTKITGQDPTWLEQPETLSEQNWMPDQPTTNDGNTNHISGTLTTTGPNPPSSLQLSGWQSWSELKTGYAQSYAVQLEAQRRLASIDWQVENGARQMGEALRKGQTYSYVLLSSAVTTTTLSGTGMPMVQTEILPRIGLPTLLQITVVNSVPRQNLPLNVEVRYTDGTSETMKFVVIEPVSTYLYLPLVAHSTESQKGQSLPPPVGVQGAWGPWTYYWAGAHYDQRLYSQIASGSGPNTSGCPSGCGATAWAMLFGWADYQAASGNTYWAPRFGLYRENGGYGTDAIAPVSMDDGVRAMTWELRNRIGTLCLFKNSPTPPWSMGKASGYLVGRTWTRLVTHYNVLGIHKDRLRDYARNSIRDRGTPAIIGTGWLSHYPLAYGYAWRSREHRACLFCPWKTIDYNRQFYVNQGWGGSGDGWISAGTWFAGEIYP